MQRPLTSEGSGERSRGFSALRLLVADFRNYESACIELSAGFNVLAGENAQGKTNLLEALYLVSTTRLLRGSRDAEAIRDGAQIAEVRATLSGGRTETGIVLERGVRKWATLNGVRQSRPADLIGRLPSICVSAADLCLAQGEPADRRLFLDFELSQLHPAYLRDLTHYKRALEQRNALLRTSRDEPVAAEAFLPWEEQLAAHGSSLRESRIAFASAIHAIAQGVHAHIGSGEPLAVEYAPKDDGRGPDEMRRKLADTRGHDVDRGSTSIGPHRDDLALEVEARDVRAFGSQGQQRTAVIALKLASLQHARETLGAPPLLLLDDILSDLDERRRSRLVEWVLENASQAVMTCTEASAAGKKLLSQSKVFRVSAGKVASE